MRPTSVVYSTIKEGIAEYYIKISGEKHDIVAESTDSANFIRTEGYGMEADPLLTLPECDGYERL